MRFATQEERIEAMLTTGQWQGAAERGIAWLTKQQDASGAWAPDVEGEAPDIEGEAPPELGADSVAPTALAMLALLGDGQVPGPAVERGGRWLAGQLEAETGEIGASIYDHVLATLALAELWNLSAQQEWLAPLQLATAHVISWQQRGSWATKKSGDGDPVLTAWATIALSAAHDGGLEIPDRTTQRTSKWIEDNTVKSGAVRRPRGAAGARERGVAAILCARQEFGQDSADAAVLGVQAKRLVKRSSLPVWPDDGAEGDYQYWFWATHGLHALGDHGWSSWQSGLADMLIDHQDPDGSWSPERASEDCVGRVGSTAFAVLSLETPYRLDGPGNRTPVSTSSGSDAPKPSGEGVVFGDRFGRRRKASSLGGRGTREHVEAGLDWLARHQARDGFWDADGFMKGSDDDCSCDGAGGSNFDVGVTGLALLAFLGDGNTPSAGQYRSLVAKGVEWLVGQQDQSTGAIGVRRGHSWMYDHIIATIALSEALLFTGDAALREPAQLAIDFLISARTPDGGWRYDAPATGSDTSVTGWAYTALHTARDAGCRVDPEAFKGALGWFDAVTQNGTFRVGYDSTGSMSARVPGVNDQFPIKGEAMTAIAMFCRRLAGEAPDSQLLELQADLLLASPPKWTPSELTVDMYYWYYGTYAMFQVGGKRWEEWNDAFKSAVSEGQRDKGEEAGSWDPVGPWGSAGGRVYSTALMVLGLEVYYRYAFVE